MALKIIIALIIFLLMLTLTVLGYDPSGRFLFAGGSTESLMDLAILPAVFPTVLLAFFSVLLFSYLKNSKKIKIVFLVAVALLWAFSGRMVGTIVYPDGRVSAGWFYIKTKRFYLCNQKTDCETTIDYHTEIERLPFWRIRIKNENADEKIF